MWQRGHKYGAKRTVVDGISFASQAEAERYCQLKLLEKIGEVRDLRLQPRFDLVVNEMKICTYVADSEYRDSRGVLHVEDVKGMRTDVYQLKRKLFEALYGIKVTEIRKGKVVDPNVPKPRRRRKTRKELY